MCYLCPLGVIPRSEESYFQKISVKAVSCDQATKSPILHLVVNKSKPLFLSQRCCDCRDGCDQIGDPRWMLPEGDSGLSVPVPLFISKCYSLLCLGNLFAGLSSTTCVYPWCLQRTEAFLDSAIMPWWLRGSQGQVAARQSGQ